MRIGFDAKRAFFNRSGLGNYSRDTIRILSDYFPMNEYILYTPKPQKSSYFYRASNLCITGPEKKWQQFFNSYWRTYQLADQLKVDNIDLYHGLSNELPKGIEKSKIPSVVTIHDIIFMRYPHFYSYFDRLIYRNKFKYAAQHASRIIAVSEQTKNDLIEYFKTPENKIDVVYQGCNPIYWDIVSESKKKETLSKYSIPDQFILYVGTIEERKNILNVLKAIHKSMIYFPIVIVGKATPYFAKVKAFAEINNMKNVHFLHNVPTDDLPALYQLSKLFVYPSLFEGFGIPILEALTSKTPVITSRGGCFAEAGGKSSVYVDPENVDELAEAMRLVLSNTRMRDNMIADGFEHAQLFKQDRIARNLMDVYEKLI